MIKFYCHQFHLKVILHCKNSETQVPYGSNLVLHLIVHGFLGQQTLPPTTIKYGPYPE